VELSEIVDRNFPPFTICHYNGMFLQLLCDARWRVCSVVLYFRGYISGTILLKPAPGKLSVVSQ